MKKFFFGSVFLFFIMFVGCSVACDVYINAVPYTISGNNTVYCLNVSVKGVNATAITIGGFVFNSSLDCQHFVLTGNGSNSIYGVDFGNVVHNNVSVLNCNLSRFGNGISGYYQHNISVKNNVLINSSNDNVYFYDSSDVEIINNTVIGNHNFGGDGIEVNYGGNNIKIFNNTISHINTNGIKLLFASNVTIVENIIEDADPYSGWGIYIGEGGVYGANLIYNNLFNNSKNYRFGGTNYTNNWNTSRQNGTRIYSAGNLIGGNYWTNPAGDGYSDTCTDANYDGFCDSPYNIAPYNSDYSPLSNKFVDSPPVVNLVVLNTSLAYVGQSLGCVFNVSDPNVSDTVVVNITWFNGSDHVIAYDFGYANISRGVVYNGSNGSVPAGVVRKGEGWKCNITANDGSAAVSSESAVLTVSNSVPAVNLIVLNATSAFVGQSLGCVFNVSDSDVSDTVVVNITWFNGSGRVTAYDFGYANISRGVVYNGSNGSVPAGVVRKGEGWRCNVTANDGSATVSNESAVLTVSNSVPSIVVQNFFVNCSDNHCFNVTAGVFDADGGGDIVSSNITVASGSCVQARNVSSGNYFNVTFNCSGTALANASLRVGFTDGSGAYDETSYSEYAYVNHIPPVSTLLLPLNQSIVNTDFALLNWSVSVDADVSDSVTYFVYFSNSSSPTFYLSTADVFLNVTGLVNGQTYYWKVVANDTYTPSSSGVYIFLVNISASSFVFVSPTPADWSRQINNYAEVKVNVSNSANNIDSCLLEWNNGSVTNLTMEKIGSGLSVVCNRTVYTLDGQVVHYQVWSNVSSGVWSNSGWRVFVENTKPTAAVSTPPNLSNTSNSYVFLNYSGDDADGDGITYYVYADYEDASTLNFSSSTNITIYNLSDGRWVYWRIVPYDGYEFGSSSSTYKFFADLSPPFKINDSVSSPSANVGGSVRVYVYVKDFNNSVGSVTMGYTSSLPSSHSVVMSAGSDSLPNSASMFYYDITSSTGVTFYIKNFTMYDVFGNVNVSESNLSIVFSSPPVSSGGGSVVVSKGSGNFSLSTVYDSKSYTLLVFSGGNRSKGVVLSNGGVNEIVVDLSCESNEALDVCSWIRFSNSSVSLPANAEFKRQVLMSVVVPKNVSSGTYYLSVIGSSASGRQVLSVVLKVIRGSSVFSLLLDKFSGVWVIDIFHRVNPDAEIIELPKAIVIIFLFLFVPLVFYWLSFLVKPLKSVFLSVVLILVCYFLILIFI